MQKIHRSTRINFNHFEANNYSLQSEISRGSTKEDPSSVFRVKSNRTRATKEGGPGGGEGKEGDR